ncbi:hypothetical protein QTP88_014750 [Uroleucon formosanum]
MAEWKARGQQRWQNQWISSGLYIAGLIAVITTIGSWKLCRITKFFPTFYSVACAFYRTLYRARMICSAILSFNQMTISRCDNFENKQLYTYATLKLGAIHGALTEPRRRLEARSGEGKCVESEPPTRRLEITGYCMDKNLSGFAFEEQLSEMVQRPTAKVRDSYRTFCRIRIISIGIRQMVEWKGRTTALAEPVDQQQRSIS